MISDAICAELTTAEEWFVGPGLEPLSLVLPPPEFVAGGTSGCVDDVQLGDPSLPSDVNRVALAGNSHGVPSLPQVAGIIQMLPSAAKTIVEFPIHDTPLNVLFIGSLLPSWTGSFRAKTA